jgi:hypothetical protein
LDWIIRPESIQRLVQQTKLPLNQVVNCLRVFRQHPDPDIDEGRTETKDKDGNVTSWRDEGEWEPTNPKKNPQGKVHNLTGQALKKTKELPTLDQDLDRIAETFSSSISTAITPGSGPQTGTLFGGTYKNPSSPFRKKSAKKKSMIKR